MGSESLISIVAVSLHTAVTFEAGNSNTYLCKYKQEATVTNVTTNTIKKITFPLLLSVVRERERKNSIAFPLLLLTHVFLLMMTTKMTMKTISRNYDVINDELIRLKRNPNPNQPNANLFCFWLVSLGIFLLLCLYFYITLFSFRYSHTNLFCTFYLHNTHPHTHT